MVQKKQWKQKSIQSVREEEAKKVQEEESEAAACAAEQSQEQERKETEIINEPEIASSLSLSKPRDLSVMIVIDLVSCSSAGILAPTVRNWRARNPSGWDSSPGTEASTKTLEKEQQSASSGGSLVAPQGRSCKLLRQVHNY